VTNELERLAMPMNRRRDVQDDSDFGVIFMTYGRKHSANLIVAVSTLRDHWRGSVSILCGDSDGLEVGRRIANEFDSINLIEFDRYTSQEYGRGASYHTKTQMGNLSPYFYSVFLDADTVVTGDIQPLFPEGAEVVLTQFANWRTTGRAMRKRIEAWRPVARDEVVTCLSWGYPAINTGVLGFSKTGRLFTDAWAEMSSRRVSFMCDEIAAQLIFLGFPHRVERDHFNASPVYSEWMKKDSDKAIVIHGHGGKFCKNEFARSIYLPLVAPLWQSNIAGIKEYSQENKRWRRYLVPELESTLT
jgi:hypothetical protein